MNFLMFKVVLEKAEEQEIKLPTPAGLAKEQESFRKTSISALPDPVAIPGELVCPSNKPGQGLAVQIVRTLVGKRTQSTVRWCTSLLVLGFLCSSPVQPPVWQLKGPAWLESHWGLQKCSRNQ